MSVEVWKQMVNRCGLDRSRDKNSIDKANRKISRFHGN